MSRFAGIDLSQLPAADVIENLDFEDELAALIARMAELMPEVEEALQLESEPLRKLLELFAYEVITLRARINDAARAVMLASAQGNDLDNLAALLGVVRLVVTPADETTTPPTEAVMESDDSLRSRTQLVLEGYTTAGSIGAYEYHARSAAGSIKDVSVTSPTPGEVVITVLSYDGDGTPPDELLATVLAAVGIDEVRPLTDHVTVVPAEILTYEIFATLEIGEGPDGSMVLEAARQAIAAYCASTHALGGTVAISGILGALHQSGVISVHLTSLVDDLAAGPGAAPYCTAITIAMADV